MQQTGTITHERSIAAFERARQVIPGGVNSPVRAFRSVGGQPVVIASGAGSRIRDVDGNEYVDYVLSWGPLILGHAAPEVVEAVTRAARGGASFGAPTEAETELAELLTALVPGAEMVRMVSSGTEATMTALRLARAATGRDRIVKFSGCYHGHADMLLVQAGSGVATLGLPDSPGVPAGATANTLVANFNDLASVEALYADYGGEIAAVIVEPIAGNMGLAPPVDGFLEGLREVTRRHGALLIFDEVLCGFRAGPRGAAALYGIEPDLVTLGKVIGGGLPLAAYAGKREIMGQVAPAGPMYQAGTLSGNPLAVAAGLATLRAIGQPGVFEALERNTARLVEGLADAASAASGAGQTARVGRLFGLFFADRPVHSWDDAATSDTARFARWFQAMLARGVYLAPSQFETGFLSTAHSDADIDRTLEAAREAMREIG